MRFLLFAVAALGMSVKASPGPEPLWSFQPVRRPPIPSTPFDRLAQNPIDRFVFARLAKEGLKPSPPADRRSLIRRVTIDLTGLPPAPEEVEAFLADRSPSAYEKLVDRLLASPAYGERWARHWLDVVRFGESHGYEQNHLRSNAWPYRDYVIRSLNEDKPFDRFVMEQLAGDLLAKGDPSVEAATGFLVAGVHDTVGIQEVEGTRQQRANDLDDIVSTTGAAFLGLTVGCARCHDHKFDPISQRDYYRMTAVFAGVQHGERPFGDLLLTEAERDQRKRLPDRISEFNDRINEIDLLGREAALQKAGQTRAPRPAVNARRNVEEFEPLPARLVRFTILATVDGAEPCLDELQVFGPDSEANLALASSGARASASSVLDGFAIHRIEHLNDGRFGNDHSWISKTRGTGWVQIALPKTARINRVVWSRDGAEIPRFDDRLPTAYRVDVSEDGETWRTVATQEGRAGSRDYVHPDAILRALTPEQREERARLVKQRDSLKEELSELESRTKVYAGQFSSPDPIFLLHRGDVMQRREEVSPAALSQIPSFPGELSIAGDAPESERRLALARWIVSPKNPLTARVIANRLWHHHFGRGIVSTPSDFGRMGDRPSHPELLDWLASELMTSWSLKKVHRLIVTSHVYRQRSAAVGAGAVRDAGNTLLWRGPHRRMEAEALRDSILAVSGTLDRRMGGPGFRLYRYHVVNVAIYEPLEEPGPETWRRGVYHQNARGIRDEVLCAFDCPESAQRFPKREVTTTALQALSLLNSPFVRQQAALFANRVLSQAGEDLDAQAAQAFRLALSRPPAAHEREAARRLIARHGLKPLTRALLNSNEFLHY